jgi:hypothetical protein
MTGIMTAPVVCLGFTEPSPTQKPQADRACGFFFVMEPNRRCDNPQRYVRRILKEQNHENL